MIVVTAEYYAAFRECAGMPSEQFATETRTAGELYEEVARRHGFADSISRCKVAINEQLAGWDTRLDDGDVVLFFPPVAGG